LELVKQLPKNYSALQGISPDTRVRDLTEDEVSKIRDVIDKTLKVEGDLRREISLNIKRLIEIGSYRGIVTVVDCLSVVNAPKPTPYA